MRVKAFVFTWSLNVVVAGSSSVEVCIWAIGEVYLVLRQRCCLMHCLVGILLSIIARLASYLSYQRALGSLRSGRSRFSAVLGKQGSWGPSVWSGYLLNRS